MHLRSATLIVSAALLLCSCTRGNDSSFEKECALIQARAPTEASLTRDAVARHNGYSTEASWEYGFAGDDAAAAKAFRATVPPDYKFLHDGSEDLVYAKYDGHDSFYLTLVFTRSDRLSTKITVLLKSVPD